MAKFGILFCLIIKKRKLQIWKLSLIIILKTIHLKFNAACDNKLLLLLPSIYERTLQFMLWHFFSDVYTN